MTRLRPHRRKRPRQAGSPRNATQGRTGDLFARADRSARFVLSLSPLRPRIGLVLGSGLGAFADEFQRAVHLDYARIPGFPASTVEGHAGRLVVGLASGVPVVALQGRVHFYEGYTMEEVTFPIRVLGRMGVRAVVLTNAAGGINTAYQRGALVAIRDHINLQGTNPLIGVNDPRFGLRFPDMTRAYGEPLRRAAREAAKNLGFDLQDGIYTAVAGPSFETPAEIRALRALGADLVGMSTVPEVIVARQMGLEVLGISCVTNMAAGILDQPITHEEVLEAGRRVHAQFSALLRALVPKISRLVAQEKK